MERKFFEAFGVERVNRFALKYCIDNWDYTSAKYLSESAFYMPHEVVKKVVKENNTVAIKEFYPMNLLQKLSMQKESVDDWRQLVESIYIDWNYDGETMRPAVCDIPGKDELVAGVYEIPSSATRIKIKITDLLSESLELEV